MPSQVDPQPQADQRTEQATADPGSEDEAIAAFNQRRQSQATTEHDAPADDDAEGASDPDADPEEGEADPDPDAAPADDLVEVTVDGETFEVPPKLEKALLRHADYSRSMNALSDTKKDYAQRLEAVERREKGVENLSKALAKVEALDAQLVQFKTTDWDKLEAEDPARASLLGLKAMRLQNARATALAEAQAVDGALVEERNKDIAARQVEMVKTLKEKFPGWGDEAGRKVTEYATKAGWSLDEIRNFTDPRLVLALEKARKYDASKEGAQQAVEKSRREVQPVAKPGARVQRADAVRDAEGRFLKSKSPEAAQALFEARDTRRRR